MVEFVVTRFAPVSLCNSVVILDEMLEENIPGGPDHFNAFFREMMQKFADIYRTTEGISFNNDFLYNIYKAQPPREEILQALIGVSFRLSSTNITIIPISPCMPSTRGTK